MRRTPELIVMATTMVLTACVGSPRAEVTTDTPAAVAATTTAVGSPITTVAASTSTSSSTTTTTIPAWQQFPQGPVKVYPPPRGSAPTLNHVETEDPVVFITIDDGLVRDPRIVQLLADHGATATLFLNAGPIHLDPGYFEPFLWLGGTINSHTSHHPHLRGMTYDQQRKEICAVVQQITKAYGGAGQLFRPPYGEWDRTTLAAAASCGVRAVVLWKETMADGELRTQGGHPLRAGDIVLLHFRPDLYDNLVALFAIMEQQGLTAARLDDYLPAA